MELKFKIQPDIARLAAKLPRDASGARRAGMINLVTEVESRARKYAPVRKSNLANSGTSEVNADGSRGTVSFIAPYARYVHEGTGLYGPHKTKIAPKAKKALYWPGAAHPVRSVKGMKANPFLLKAAKETNMAKLFVEGAERFLKRR
jgi:hypothetical protein